MPIDKAVHYRYRTIYYGKNICAYCGKEFPQTDVKHHVKSSKGNIHEVCWPCFKPLREKRLAYSRQYYQKNREKRRQTARETRLRHLEKYRTIDRTNNADPKRKKKKLWQNLQSYWRHRDEILARRKLRKQNAGAKTYS